MTIDQAASTAKFISTGTIGFMTFFIIGFTIAIMMIIKAKTKTVRIISVVGLIILSVIGLVFGASINSSRSKVTAFFWDQVGAKYGITMESDDLSNIPAIFEGDGKQATVEAYDPEGNIVSYTFQVVNGEIMAYQTVEAPLQ